MEVKLMLVDQFKAVLEPKDGLLPIVGDIQFSCFIEEAVTQFAPLFAVQLPDLPGDFKINIAVEWLTIVIHQVFDQLFHHGF
jgi:hypothetical protein